MNTIIKKAALVAALATASLSANAAESHITVYTNVDMSLALLKEDGSALPDEIPLTHVPGTTGGLRPHIERVRIFTNAEDKDVEIRLATVPNPVNTEGKGVPVPLTVRLNSVTLTDAAQDFLASDIYDGAIPGRSIIMPLEIAQTTRAPIPTEGRFEGMVSVILAQKP
ncbi:MAG: CFA/I fimbrial subunit B [Stenotrophomonas maltophilia]|uniref:CFA/I fimbrial subunit B n=1 Tax=Stenotrophomonas maltophilia TaxID=40324 RepID=A0A7V8JKZ7_STEMA|nr:MAG: CFA/I fimbrial subunit B [Stenotrophomonas maltophilia]